MSKNMQNKTPKDQVTPPNQPKKQLTEYELICAAIPIPENWRVLVLARIFYCALIFSSPFWIMGRWR